MTACFIIFLLLALISGLTAANTPALFAFGDSLVDSGNNNLLSTRARADHSPYGVDFVNHTATGRWSNGKLVVDFIAEKLGLALPIPYMYVYERITPYDGQSVNFASASTGILNSTGFSGLTFTRQVSAFEDISRRLSESLGSSNAEEFLSKSIFYVSIGNNDVNDIFHSKYGYSRIVYPFMQPYILQTFQSQMERLYHLGARKFVVVGLSAVGCIPINLQGFRRECANWAQSMATSYNTALDSLLDQFRTRDGIQIVKTDFYKLMTEVHDNPSVYGFENSRGSCCPENGVSLNCNVGTSYCSDRSSYVFWDGVHQTEQFNSVAASTWWSGTLDDVYPMNISSLAAQ